MLRDGVEEAIEGSVDLAPKSWALDDGSQGAKAARPARTRQARSKGSDQSAIKEWRRSLPGESQPQKQAESPRPLHRESQPQKQAEAPRPVHRESPPQERTEMHREPHRESPVPLPQQAEPRWRVVDRALREIAA